MALILIAAAVIVWPPRWRISMPAGASAATISTTSLRTLGRMGLALGASSGLLWGPLQCVAFTLIAFTIEAKMKSVLAQRDSKNASRSVVSALEVLTAELSVGAHPAAACGHVAQDCSDPALAETFDRAASFAQLGGDAAAVFTGHGTAQLKRLGRCWRLAQQHGLPMIELMNAAKADVTARERFTARVQASLAGARATALVLSALPIIGICLGELIGASPVAMLLTPGLGGVLLVVGVTLTCGGLLWSDRIVGKVMA